MIVQEFVDRASKDRRFDADVERTGESSGWDWKEVEGAKYRFLCQFGEENGIDPEAEFEMPDGDNCPRAFREWWQDATTPLRERMTAKEAAAELAEYGGNPYVRVIV